MSDATRGPARSADEDAYASLLDGHNNEPTPVASRNDDRRPTWRSRLRQIGLFIVVLASVLGLALAGAGWFLTNRYAGNVHRLPTVFAGLDPSSRPAAPHAGGDPPVTFLLVGADTRAPGPTTGSTATSQAENTRSDAIMLLRITGDRRDAQVISIPRDSWVTIPGHDRNKINAAYAFGSPSLLIQTVEALTNVRVDHFGVIDFAGFKTMTDALGGVDVAVSQPTSSMGVTFTEGVNHLNGDQALVYVRQRYELSGGDFDREQRQQNYLRAMLTTASHGDLLGNPGKLDAFIRALTGSVSVDDELSSKDLVTLAFGSRDLKPGSVAFLTAPVTGTGMEGDQSVVYLDETADAALWRYLNNDSLAQHVAQFKQLPATPN